MSDIIQYPCPRCEEEFEFNGNDTKLKCESCGCLIKVSPDAEFIDGSWRDRTSVKEISFHEY